MNSLRPGKILFVESCARGRYPKLLTPSYQRATIQEASGVEQYAAAQIQTNAILGATCMSTSEIILTLPQLLTPENF